MKRRSFLHLGIALLVGGAMRIANIGSPVVQVLASGMDVDTEIPTDIGMEDPGYFPTATMTSVPTGTYTATTTATATVTGVPVGTPPASHAQYLPEVAR